MATSNSINNPDTLQTMMAPRHIPTLAYTVQNIFMSMATMMTSTATFFFTLFFVLPLSMLRAITPSSVLQHPNAGGMNKVVLIIGATHGIGYSVLRQYMNEPDTVVIATARSIGKSTRRSLESVI
jgi:FlaA1/EpsC-like NDP-sugar epimerase